MSAHDILRAGLGLGLLAALAAESSGEKVSATPNLSGTWRLERAVSDPPDETMREGGSGRGSSGRGRGGGGMGGPRGMGGGRPRGGSGSEPGFAPGGPPEEAMRELKIHQDGATVTIVHADDSQRVLQVDGREREEPTPWDDTRRIKSRWDKARLVVERRNDRGKMTEVFELAPDGESLSLTTTRKSSRGGERTTHWLYRLHLTEPVSGLLAPS